MIEDAQVEVAEGRRFEGEFKPPRMGSRHMPLPVAGPGHVEVKSEGLVVEGYATSRKSCLMVLLFFAGFVVFIAGGVYFELGDLGIETVAYLALPAFFGVALKGRGDSYREDEPVRLEIPWEKVREVDYSGTDGTELDEMVGKSDGEIEILVKDHDPKGMLHFHPMNGAEELARGVRAAARLK